MVTRKLRRRHYDPLPTVEKRRRAAPLSSLVYVLDENEMDEDIRMIFKVCFSFVCVNYEDVGMGCTVLSESNLMSYVNMHGSI